MYEIYPKQQFKNKYLSFKYEIISILFAYKRTFKKEIYKTYGILLNAGKDL
jgi:hypothetical protein